MRRILLFGRYGQVGWELERSLAALGSVQALDRNDLDLTDSRAIRGMVKEAKPNIIVNAAGYTAVEKAQTERETAIAINGIAPGVMAEEAKKIGALMVHYSTDYVFDGSKTTPYAEEDIPNPLNAYGESKLLGEKSIQHAGGAYLIFRSSWIYGARGGNFARTIIRLATERDEVRVVDDQVGAPTWSRAVAEFTAQVIALCCCLTKGGHWMDAQGRRAQGNFAPVEAVSGIYHMTAAGRTTWYGFAEAVLKRLEALDCLEHTCPEVRSTAGCKLGKLIPIPTSEYPSKIARPANSILSNDKIARTFGLRMPTWKAQLEMAF